MPTVTVNKRARFDYEIIETFEAGMELKGFEVKSVKNGRVQLTGSYAVPQNNELWLLNADISPYQTKNTTPEYNQRRSRRLLLNRKEIKYLIGKIKEQGLTIIPIEMYTKGSFVKIKIGLARSRKKTDKRELIKKREVERELRRVTN
ncbi:SsrA-binding protein SmpB [Candidatus Jorgensenbacteria bacterium]|nr:SsrA-binding protein SmpB [Candidatus Jorgensenbacteria bacterium]